jgi:hypothetical protein
MLEKSLIPGAYLILWLDGRESASRPGSSGKARIFIDELCIASEQCSNGNQRDQR